MPETNAKPEPTAKERPWLHRLRIIASGFFALAFCALAVSWPSSYWWRNICGIGWPDPDVVGFDSFPGSLVIGKTPNVYLGKSSWLVLTSIPVSPRDHTLVREQLGKNLKGCDGFAIGRMGAAHIAIVPYWAAMMFTGILAFICSRPIQWRFSLRTLLIAMTVIAVALGTLAVALH